MKFWRDKCGTVAFSADRREHAKSNDISLSSLFKGIQTKYSLIWFGWTEYSDDNGILIFTTSPCSTMNIGAPYFPESPPFLC
jgi:hypothetical protein